MLGIFSLGLIVQGSGLLAQDVPPVALGTAKYSPYPAQDFPNQVLFGDTHLHTSFSTDAGMLGNTLGPDNAYRFAKGETVVSSTGSPARLARPLDFLVIADHAENLGLAPALAASAPELLATDWGRDLHEIVAPGTVKALGLGYEKWGLALLAGDDPLKGSNFAATMWQKLTEAGATQQPRWLYGSDRFRMDIGSHR